MRILVADTSSSVCITGVFEDDKLITENCLDDGKTHSENFMPLIKQSLEDAKLGLSDIDVIHGRAEDFAKPGQLREQYDLCVSRAVANLSVLSEYCLPYVKVGGKFISYKSEKIVEEMKDAEYAIQVLGGRIGEQVSFTLPDSDLFRNLFVVEKCDLTPAKYPRKAGMASKKPLKMG